MKQMSMDIFDQGSETTPASRKPLAERMRPLALEGFFGQEDAVGPGTLLQKALETGELFSIILWGPPGCGKTTLAGILAGALRSHFVQFSAVLSGVKEIRAVIAEARTQQQYGKQTILFVDEIHRFNKAQQDAFLHHVESGLITLIGATTENPSFEIIPPLLSRCMVISLKPLSDDEIGRVLRRALQDSENGLGAENLEIDPDAESHLIRLSRGDARTALNNLDMAAAMIAGKADESTPKRITVETVERALRKKAMLYDKSGEEHFNLISALHKSLRGGDPDAALYWLARMIKAGEDPLYIARRMVRFASEDIGMADPLALGVALNAVNAFQFNGKPEGELALAQAAVHLATAPKSNSIYVAYGKAGQAVEKHGYLPVPMHIRNAPTKMMEEMGYGKGYRYAHDYKDAYVDQTYLPDRISGDVYYEPNDRGYEKTVKSRLDRLRRRKGDQSAGKSPDGADPD